MHQHVYHEATDDQLGTHIAPQTCYIDGGPQVVGISYQGLQKAKLAAQQHQQQQQYAGNLICGPHKLAIKQDQSQQALQQQIQQKQASVYQTQQHQMTDAEKLKADKEQLKLNLQNFRKTQKTVKQIQMAKQSAAAIQAQKSSNGLNNTYQAFDLQNYKSPEDCIIGLQSAKKMLQQSTVFQGTQTTNNPAQACLNHHNHHHLTTGLENMAGVYGTAKPVNQANNKLLPSQQHQAQQQQQRQQQQQMIQRPPPTHQMLKQQAAQFNSQQQSTLQKSAQQKLQQQQQQLSSRQLQAMSTHQPPPPQARRKRGHREQHKENSAATITNASDNSMLMPMSLQNQAVTAAMLPPQQQQQQIIAAAAASSSGSRQGRFIPSHTHRYSNQEQSAQSSQPAAATATSQFQAQNMHPNLPGSQQQQQQKQQQLFQPAPSPANQPTNQSDRKSGAGSRPQERLPQKSVNQQTSIMANAYFTEQQLHKIASCLNYDQGEICRLFQQKYNELIVLNEQQMSQDGEISQQLVEPNLSLFFQLVQNDLIAKQQWQSEQTTTTAAAAAEKYLSKQKKPLNRKQKAAATGNDIKDPEQQSQQLQYQLNQAVYYVNNHDAEEEEASQDLHQQLQQQQRTKKQQHLSKASSSSVSNNPPASSQQTVSSSEQQSVSSTLAVVMGSDDIGYCEEDDVDDEDIDSSSNCCENDDDDDQYQQHSCQNNPSNLMISDYDYQEVDEDVDEADDENCEKSDSDSSMEDQQQQEHPLDCREPVGCCYGADATEAYESYEEPQPSHQHQHQHHQSTMQQQLQQRAAHHQHPAVYHHLHQQQQHQHYDMPASCDLKYHQFSQSDYVEAVEGFTAEDDDDELEEASRGELDAARQRHKIAYLQTSGGHRHEIIQDEQQQCCVDDDDDVVDLYEDEQEIGDDDLQGDDDDEFLHDAAAEEQEEDDDEDEEQLQYIEEEEEQEAQHHQFTLNQLYSQAHKQLVNGFGPADFVQKIPPTQQIGHRQQQQYSVQKVSSKEDAHAWQSLYPRLFNEGGITPQSLEQMISLGQANMTPYQAQEILNFQQKQLRQGIAANGNQQEQSDIIFDEDGNQQAYEWCSKDSFEESNQEGEIEHNHDTIQSTRLRTSDGLDGKQSDHNNVVYQDDLSQNLIHSTLQPPSHLSPAFKRFFTEFENNIDFILRSDYEILPQLRSNSICKAEQKRLKIKYENLLTASRDMCRRFTGPHSVLQVFIEKIVASIKIIAHSLKESTKNDFGLWTEVHIPITSDAQQQQKRKLKTNSSSLLIGHHKRSSSANPELLITKKSKSNEQHQTAKQDDDDDVCDEAEGSKQPEEQAYIVELRPKPLLSCIDKYTEFLNELRAQYILIMTNCAPKISKHFTKLTAVIVENTQYEFPSAEIHKAVISKLILNDERCFKQLVQHLQSEFRLNEAQIRRENHEFLNALDLFIREVDDDMRAIQTKIDIYMRDLRKHALDEYEDLYNDEQDQIRLGRSVDGKRQRQRQKKKNRKKKERQAAAADQSDTNEQDHHQLQQENTNNDNTTGAGADEAATMPPSSSANQMIDETGNEATNNGKKKKRNRRSKNKANQSVTNELLNNLDTDDLVDFINNCGSKKEDLKKQGSANKANPEEMQIAADQQKQSQFAVEPFNDSQANENGAANQPQSEFPNQNKINKPDTNAAQKKDQSGKMEAQNAAKTKSTVPKQSKKQRRGKKNKLKKANDQFDQAVEQSGTNSSAQQSQQQLSPNDQISQPPQVIAQPQKDQFGKKYLQSSNSPAADQPSKIKAGGNIDKLESDGDLEEASATDIQLEAFKEGLLSEAAIQYFGMKLKPNVSNEWLRKVHQRLVRVNQAALASSSCKPDAKWQSSAI